jgi:hypothetical protein
MAVYDFVVVGVIPLLIFVLWVRNSEAEVLFSVALYCGVMGAAVWAWSGDNTGRWALLATVTFVALQWIVRAYVMLSGSAIASGNRPRAIGVISRGLFTIALNWWYFNRKSTVKYYTQNSSKKRTSR